MTWALPIFDLYRHGRAETLRPQSFVAIKESVRDGVVEANEQNLPGPAPRVAGGWITVVVDGRLRLQLLWRTAPPVSPTDQQKIPARRRP